MRPRHLTRNRLLKERMETLLDLVNPDVSCTLFLHRQIATLIKCYEAPNVTLWNISVDTGTNDAFLANRQALLFGRIQIVHPANHLPPPALSDAATSFTSRNRSQ